MRIKHELFLQFKRLSNNSENIPFLSCNHFFLYRMLSLKISRMQTNSFERDMKKNDMLHEQLVITKQCKWIKAPFINDITFWTKKNKGNKLKVNPLSLPSVQNVIVNV